MAARLYSEFKERKISGGSKYSFSKAGSAPAMKEKPAFPGCGVPGKVQSGGRSLGITKCKIYPKSEGL